MKALGVLLADAIDRFAGFAEPDRQTGEIAVAGNCDKPVRLFGIEDIHRINDQAESVEFLPVV